jgi:hypothetical protein
VQGFLLLLLLLRFQAWALLQSVDPARCQMLLLLLRRLLDCFDWLLHQRWCCWRLPAVQCACLLQHV